MWYNRQSSGSGIRRPGFEIQICRLLICAFGQATMSPWDSISHLQHGNNNIYILFIFCLKRIIVNKVCRVSMMAQILMKQNIYVLSKVCSAITM